MSAVSRIIGCKLLAQHYGRVLGAAWSQRKAMQGPKRDTGEAAFLPAALALQEAPPSPAPRVAAALIVLLFASAIVWACLGQIDVVAVAQGRVMVSDRTKLIQPVDTAVVKAVHVQDGMRVRQGDLLVELDSTLTTADKDRLRSEWRSAQRERWRTAQLLAWLDRQRPAPPPPLEQADKLQAESEVRAERVDLDAKRARLTAELRRRQAEVGTTDALVAKLETTLPLAAQRALDYQNLVNQHFMSAHGYQDRERERIELERDLASQRAKAVEVRAGLQEGHEALRTFEAEALRALSDRWSQAQLKCEQLEQELRKAEQKDRLMQLRAPVSGAVQQLAVHTTGGVVTPAQVLMVIVPDASEVTAEVVVENKDIGFVHTQQHAEVKLETFPYTKYGTLAAQVSVVSADAVMDEHQGAIFPAVLKLNQKDIAVDGKRVNLVPGMKVTAEIKTGKRRVIEYFLSPLQTYWTESMKER